MSETGFGVIDPSADKGQAGKNLTRSVPDGKGKATGIPESVYPPEIEECSIGVKSLKRNRISNETLKNKGSNRNVLHKTQINRIARIQISTILGRNANALIRRVQHTRVNNKLVSLENLSLI